MHLCYTRLGHTCLHANIRNKSLITARILLPFFKRRSFVTFSLYNYFPYQFSFHFAYQNDIRQFFLVQVKCTFVLFLCVPPTQRYIFIICKPLAIDENQSPKKKSTVFTIFLYQSMRCFQKLSKSTYIQLILLNISTLPRRNNHLSIQSNYTCTPI